MTSPTAPSPSGSDRRQLFVSAGTDVHPFDRLTEWADEAARNHAATLEVFIQFGTGNAPQVAGGASLLSTDEFSETLARADAAVVSCGPGAVMAVRRAGLLPIVVPRRYDLGEHVDDHQSSFAHHLDEHGMGVATRTAAEFDAAVTRLLGDPTAFKLPGGPEVPQPEGPQRIARLIDELVWGATPAALEVR